MIDDVEIGCVEQIDEFINHPAFTKPVVIMPDCHKGMGCVIGFTMLLDTDNVIKIIPNTIGVDIGSEDGDKTVYYEFISGTYKIIKGGEEKNDE